MPTIKQLNQRNESFDLHEWHRLKALYEGGKAFREHLHDFLPRRPAEPQERWMLRRKEANYRNYLGPIIDFFTALLFTSKPIATAKSRANQEEAAELPEYYGKFREDADRAGCDIDAIFKDLLTDAMVHRCSWLRLRHPKGTSDGLTRQEFDKLGAGDSWVQKIEGNNVLDWATDENGILDWALTYSVERRRQSLDSAEPLVIETWEHLTRDSVDVYRIEYVPSKKPPDSTLVPLVESYPHRYAAVPLVLMELPIGIWVANRLETPQIGHFRLTNAQTWGLAQACYAMPVFKVKDVAKFKANQVGAGYGFVIGPEESIEFAAPSAAPFDALRDEIKAHKDEIYRVAEALALGVENNAAAVGRSAESKQSDAEATRVVLLAFARHTKETIERVYDLISAAKGDDYEWSIAGLDDFASKDLGGLTEVLERVDRVGGIASRTFNVKIQQRLAESILPDLDEETRQQIKQEIEANTPEPGDELEAEVERLHALASGLNGDENPRGNRARGRAEPPEAPGGRSGRAAPPAQAS